jgi:hypothetical protein
MSTLDIRKDPWRSVMLDSHSVSTVVRLRKDCGTDKKVTFDGAIPLIVPKTRIDRPQKRLHLDAVQSKTGDRVTED